MNEVYKLTLEHYIVGEDGRKYNIDKPVSTQCIIWMRDGISAPIVVNDMIEKMKDYLLNLELEK